MTTRMLPTLLAALGAVLALATPAQAGHRGTPSYGPPPGRIVVTNQSGGDVTLVFAGETRPLPAWRTTEIVAMPGEATLRANYQQFGMTRTLQSERVYISPNRTISVTLEPEDEARVLVTNQSPFYARLEVDDRPDASFKPGESRVVTVPVGRAELEMVADGRTFARTHMDLRPFAEPRWYAEAPRVGTLVVTNPLPIPVELVCDKGLVRTVPAYGQATYADLAPGGFGLTARRVTGEYIDRERTEIRPGAVTSWRVDPPRTGFVAVDSDHWLGASIEIDDRRVRDLGANENARLELSVGWHEIEVKDTRGREILDTWIEVEPYEVARVSFGRPEHERAHEHREHDRDHDDRRSERDDHRGHDHGTTVADAESCSMR